MKICILLCLFVYVNSEMVFEMRLLEFKNYPNRTYSNQLCGPDTSPSENCRIGFLFCLVDLPFRNPQNCSLGDHTTPVLGSNHIDFSSKNFTYKFRIKKIPPKGIGMMAEVRDYYDDDKYQHVDFYTNALADVPLSIPISNSIYTVRKSFTSLFDHNSSLTVESKLYCAKDFYGSDCDTYCSSNSSLHYTCNQETGQKVCLDGFTGQNCDTLSICKKFPCLNNGTCFPTDDENYYCECKSGFEGPNCELNVQDPCFSMPCFNNGKCNSIGSKFMCECVPGFHGTYCEADLRQCSSNPCSPECQCAEIPSNMTYECKCPYVSPKAVNRAGFYSTLNYLSNARPGPFSPVPNFVNNELLKSRSMTSTKLFEPLDKDDLTLSKKQPCVDFNPCKHGQCLLNKTTGEFRCECEVGYMGPFCDLIRHPCDFKPCENGICEIVGDLYYKCLCKPNWTGVNCHIEIKPCDESKCLNGGKCKLDDIYGTGCDCKAEFTGYYCETEIIDPDPCESNPCQNEGLCRIKFSDYKSEYECLCPESHFGKNCELQRSTCETKQCLNGATCIQFNSSLASCKCADGFFGETCQNDENECLRPGICPKNSYCNNKFGSYECICYEGYYMKNFICQSIATLLKTAPTITISASDTTLTGDTTDSIQNVINTTTPLITSASAESTISESIHSTTLTTTPATITSPTTTTSLATPTSTESTTISTLVTTTNLETIVTTTNLETTTTFQTSSSSENYCHLCQNNSTCSLESLKCICWRGYRGEFCDQKVDICDEQKPCLNEGTCIQNDRFQSGYLCECKADFTGQVCETKLHVCELENPCQNKGKCVQNFDGFLCQCEIGFTGTLCENKMHLCDVQNPCQNGGLCNKVESFNAYTCSCAAGFTGLNCEHEMDACVTLPCKNGGLCQSRPKGTFYCDCPIGFTGDQCEHDIEVCGYGVCKNNAECIEGRGENYTCICTKGFTGKACQIELDPCDPQPCQNDGKCVRAMPAKYKCECSSNFTGAKCETKIDKCKHFCNNNSSCIIENDEPKCVCDSFYFGEKCERSIKLLCENKHCINHGHCRINEVTRMPECACPKGYSGDLCETKNICSPKNQKISCYNNSTCLYDQKNQEFCECQNGFAGDNCEISLRNGSSQSIARDASSLASSDKNALTDQANSENTPPTDNGVWLIVIVFGYIFGLFLIFVVIWFIWYGTSIKRGRRSSSSSSQNNLNPASGANSNHFSSFSASSSLSRHGGKEIINGYSPAHNMAFNNRDEYFQKSNLLTQDDLSGSHSTSFVHSYHHRI